MGNRGALHYSAEPGKRVLVRMRDGRIIKGKFEEKRSRYIVIDGQKLLREEIEAFIIAKHADHHPAFMINQIEGGES